MEIRKQFENSDIPALADIVVTTIDSFQVCEPFHFHRNYFDFERWERKICGINTCIICRFSIEIDRCGNRALSHDEVNYGLNNKVYHHFNLVIAKLACVLGIPICPPENALQAVSELTFVMCQKCQNQASLYRPHSNERQSWIKMKTETSKNTSKSVDFSVP